MEEIDWEKEYYALKKRTFEESSRLCQEIGEYRLAKQGYLRILDKLKSPEIDDRFNYSTKITDFLDVAQSEGNTLNKNVLNILYNPKNGNKPLDTIADLIDGNRRVRWSEKTKSEIDGILESYGFPKMLPRSLSD